MFRYIDDVLSINNSRFGDFVDRIYPIELKIKDTIYNGKQNSIQTPLQAQQHFVYSWNVTNRAM